MSVRKSCWSRTRGRAWCPAVFFISACLSVRVRSGPLAEHKKSLVPAALFTNRTEINMGDHPKTEAVALNGLYNLPPARACIYKYSCVWNIEICPVSVCVCAHTNRLDRYTQQLFWLLTNSSDPNAPFTDKWNAKTLIRSITLAHPVQR